MQSFQVNWLHLQFSRPWSLWIMEMVMTGLVTCRIPAMTSH